MRDTHLARGEAVERMDNPDVILSHNLYTLKYD